MLHIAPFRLKFRSILFSAPGRHEPHNARARLVCPGFSRGNGVEDFCHRLAIFTLISGWAGAGKSVILSCLLDALVLDCGGRVAYLLASLYQTVRSAKISQPPPDEDYTSGSISVTWILFAVAAYAEAMIAILLWWLVYSENTTLAKRYKQMRLRLVGCTIKSSDASGYEFVIGL
jgi:hypothetical protein